MSLSTSRLMAAPRPLVWEAFCDMLQWPKRGLGCEVAGSRAQGPRSGDEVRFRLKPAGLAASVAAEITESIPQEVVAWQGGWPGLTSRRRIQFSDEDGGTRVTSQEQLSGWGLLLLRPFYSPRRLGNAGQNWLAQLARHAETAYQVKE